MCNRKKKKQCSCRTENGLSTHKLCEKVQKFTNSLRRPRDLTPCWDLCFMKPTNAIRRCEFSPGIGDHEVVMHVLVSQHRRTKCASAPRYISAHERCRCYDVSDKVRERFLTFQRQPEETNFHYLCKMPIHKLFVRCWKSIAMA